MGNNEDKQALLNRLEAFAAANGATPVKGKSMRSNLTAEINLRYAILLSPIDEVEAALETMIRLGQDPRECVGNQLSAYELAMVHKREEVVQLIDAYSPKTHPSKKR